uniref:Uncharacterized protein n=1 Tax=Arundo donax TaxID=35708 RepID=A0A0A9G6X2_ARUDO
MKHGKNMTVTKLIHSVLVCLCWLIVFGWMGEFYHLLLILSNFMGKICQSLYLCLCN